MTKELTTTSPTSIICNAIDKMGANLKDSLYGTGISVDRFLAVAKTAVQTHSAQKDLENADRNSLYLAIKKAAGDGLMPDGREAALVIYNTKQPDNSYVKTVQYQPMVQGLVKLARKSGEIEKIGAFIVYEKDSFKYQVGIDDIPVHSAPIDENGNHLWFSNRGNPIGVWAFVKLKSGDYIDPVMLTKERIDRIATRSKMAGNYNFESKKVINKYNKEETQEAGKDWEEFWKKAAIRNVLKYAPKSTSLEQALQKADDEFDLSNESVSYEPTQVDPINDAPKTETRASAVIKKKAEPEADNIIDLEPTNFEEEEIPV